MSRYIDAEWLLNFFEPYPNEYHTPLGTLRACVDDAPSIDIVHCSACKHCKRVDGLFCCNHWHDNYGFDAEVDADVFCSYGEREDER